MLSTKQTSGRPFGACSDMNDAEAGLVKRIRAAKRASQQIPLPWSARLTNASVVSTP